MIKKKVLLTFIEEQRTKALKELMNKWEPQILATQKEELEKRGYTAKVKELAKDISWLNSRIRSLYEELKNDTEIKYNPGYYSSLERLIISNEPSENDLLQRLLSSVSFGEVIQEANRNYTYLCKEVNQNYTNLYNNCTGMTAKNIVKYLTELGFDLSSLEENETVTSLINPVNVDSLFIKRSNNNVG